MVGAKMTLYELRKIAEASNDILSMDLNKFIAQVESRSLELEKEFKEAHDPRHIFEVKGRDKEVCAILGRESKIGNRPEPTGW